MKSIQTSILAGAAAVLLTGAFSTSFASGPRTHVMTVRLPGGGVEQIRYAGDVPPRLVIEPDGWATLAPAWAAAFLDSSSPFATMEQISAAMDRQMQTMLRETDAVAANPGLWTVSAGNLPPGAQSYSFVSTASGNGVCARSVEITSAGNGQKPHVVSRSYGDCGSAHAGPGVKSVAPAESQPGVRDIRYTRPQQPVLREASATE